MAKYYMKKYHYVLEIVAYVLLAVSFLMAIVGMIKLPAEIATHYDIHGNIDGYDKNWTLLVLPAIMLLSQIIMSVSLHLVKTSKWNMPFDIKPGREPLVYGDNISVVVFMMVLCGIFTVAFELLMIFQLGKWMMPCAAMFVVGLFAIIIFFMIKMAKDNK